MWTVGDSPSTYATVQTRKKIAFKSATNMLLASRRFAKRNKVYGPTVNLDDLNGICKYFLWFGKSIGLVPFGAGLTEANQVLEGYGVSI